MPRFNDLTTGSVNYGVDVRKRIINVDALYRDSKDVAYNALTNINGNRITDFLFRLTTPVSNVSEMKVVSVELSSITFVGKYLLLQINDESSIESQGGSGATAGTEIRSVAKIQAPLSGTVVAVTDSTGLISYPVSFRNPKDFNVLRVRIVNPDGTVAADAGSGTVSFTLELTEVVNSYLYESNRKHLGYDPANVRS
jgi:hypothetical protein